MFEEYGEYFSEPSEVDLIIDEAKEKLNALLTEEVKQTMEQAKAAKKSLEKIQGEIREAKISLGNLVAEHKRQEQKWENLDQYRMPRQYIKKLVEAVAGDFAPGDTVYAIRTRYGKKDCPMCHGEKTLEGTVTDRPGLITFSCPTCKGLGYLEDRRLYVEETKVTSVDVKLRFRDDRVSYWSNDCLYLGNREYSTRPEDIFHTKEEAEKALAERMAREET